MSEVPARASLGETPCMAEGKHPANDGLLICNAIDGHEGPHAAYAGPGNLVHSWPKEAGHVDG